jgi:hypothetical protein
MKFKDFENDYSQLIGKKVLYESGMSYSERLSRSIVQIQSVTKTGFKLLNMSTLIFGFDGHQKGLTGRQNMGTISKCKLLTDEEVESLRVEWKAKKELKAAREELRSKIDSLTIEQLNSIKSII